MLLQQHTAALFVVACVSAIVALAARFLRRTTLPTSSKRNPNAPLSPAHRAQLLQGSRQRAGAVSVMLEWMGWSAGSAGKQANKKQLSPAEKLRGYHELAKDALEHAYQADTSGQPDKAVKLYRMAVEAIDEGLQLPVQGSGLGPMADSVAGFKRDMQNWRGSAVARQQFLEARLASGGAAAAAPAQEPEPVWPSQPNLALGTRPPGPAQHQQAAGANRRATQQPQQQRRRTTGSDGGGAVGRALNGAAARLGAGGRAGGIPQAALVGGGSVPAGGGASSSSSKEEDKLRQVILQEVLDQAPTVKWDDIAGLQAAKQALQEAVVLPALRPDLFSGPLRAPVRGILLYGPPGNGKTMLGKALAHEAKAQFFAISASSLTSKWVGEGEKLVRALFAVAAEQAPSIIFIDEIDSILGARGGANEHDAARRLKTEFLVQFDGVASSHNERVVVVGATNRPHEIDDAVRRRLVKRIYIPLPSLEGRAAVVQHLLKGQPHALSQADLQRVLRATEGYSASDLTALCKEAAMGPLREVSPSALVRISPAQLRPIKLDDFAAALSVIKPSCNREMLKVYEDFTRDFGTQA